MLTDNLILLFNRDLDKLTEEVKLYEDEKTLWVIKEVITNSAGNLVLHLLGNLKHFVGGVLSGTGYIRNREAEFSSKDIPAEKLIAGILQTKEVISQYLKNVTKEDMEKVYPLQVFGYEMTTGFFMVHLYGHLAYHLGQISYHRRLIHA